MEDSLALLQDAREHLHFVLLLLVVQLFLDSCMSLIYYLSLFVIDFKKFFTFLIISFPSLDDHESFVYINIQGLNLLLMHCDLLFDWGISFFKPLDEYWK